MRALIDGAWRDGVASFGRRPTFDNGAPLLETFVFDYAGDLYGRDLRVTFERYIRPEIAFTGMEALMVQMDQDSADAKAALAGLAPLSPVDAVGEEQEAAAGDTEDDDSEEEEGQEAADMEQDLVVMEDLHRELNVGLMG